MFRASAALVSSVLLLFATGPLWRAATADDDDKEPLTARESDETSRLIRAELPNWKLSSGADREHELTLHPKAVLRWSNPGVGRVYGDVYLWTRDGRPEAVISFYKWYEPHYGFTAEMHSLSLTGLSAEREGVLRWQPTMGTDPEVLLLLEARRSSDKFHWQYGLARMNDCGMTVRYKDQEVWHCEKKGPLAVTGPITDPYKVQILRR